jgi:glyoxylase-like metal-dependent hydrolase (beta-lactamase superfamily II)
MAAIAAPDLHIPHSSSTVQVSIIDTTTSIKGVDAWKFLSPSIPGHDHLAAPAFSFLIQHPSLDRSLVFDLGLRKDWWNCSPFLLDRFKAGGYVMNVEQSVREILEEGGFDASKSEAVVWSHWHFDHTGSPAEFETSTSLIVGPGFKKNLLPGYPANPNSSVLESDFEGRELVELRMVSGLKIGEMDAEDYFGDGSLYFLNSPGHAHGHICALARVTAEPPSFILMGGDAYHHGGELRPSPYLPLPQEIQPHPCMCRCELHCKLCRVLTGY